MKSLLTLLSFALIGYQAIGIEPTNNIRFPELLEGFSDAKPIRKANVTFYVKKSQFEFWEDEEYPGFEMVSEAVCVRKGLMPVYDGDSGVPALFEPCEYTDSDGNTSYVMPAAASYITDMDLEMEGFDLDEVVRDYTAVLVEANVDGEARGGLVGMVTTVKLEGNALWITIEPDTMSFKGCQKWESEDDSCDPNQAFITAVVKVEDVK